MLDFDKLIFIVWRFIKDKRGQMRAIDFAIALSIFLIAFSQVLGMAINSATSVTEQTTNDHMYVSGNSISTILLTSTGGFDWDDISASNLENADGHILGLHNWDFPCRGDFPDRIFQLEPFHLSYMGFEDQKYEENGDIE